VPRYLLASHDGYGLGHARRSSLLASALLDADPASRVTLVTGLPFSPSWLGARAMEIVRVPPMLKHQDHGYQALGMSFEEAVARRAEVVLECVDRHRPDVVVVDRHPYGIAGELRPGLEAARSQGARVLLGLRDVLDDPAVVREETTGAGWNGVEDVYDEALVYGARHFCDHATEYGLPLPVRYCGWVVDAPETGAPRRVERLLSVAAGGGGDGREVFRLGIGVAERRPDWSVMVSAGPYADTAALARLVARSPARARIAMVTDVAGCTSLFARAGAVLEMAGYNSTFEALAAGHRPILVPRQRPRVEQLIRAQRLAALGLADVVDEDAAPSTVTDLLDRPRRLAPEDLARSGITLDGACRAASIIHARATSTRP